MSRVLTFPAFACFFAGLAAQAPGGFTVRAIDGAVATAAGLVWELGTDDAFGAPPGRAAVLAHCRLAHAHAAAPGVQASLHVDAELTCIVGVVPASGEAELLAFLGALLDDGADLRDDALALATARAALAADDAQWLLPGGVLAMRARQVLVPWSGPLLGDPAAMLAMTPTAVRELLAAPTGVGGAVLGAVSPALRERLANWPLPASPPPPRTSSVLVPMPQPQIREEVHARVDQPFVMAAFAAPRGPSLPAFALGLEVARQRAAQTLPPRGSEARAMTPAVAWSWLAGDRVVRFHRRGTDPLRLLPGEVAADAAAELAATARELEGLLVGLREVPPTADELSNARTHLLSELGLTAPSPAHGDPAVLAGRLRAALLAQRRGIVPAAITAVTPQQAPAALLEALASGGCYWHALMPEPRANQGWRRR